ncbi:MAG: hypothetical protein K8R85_05810 [Bacteroidetes bacterium]|nr:hypothetical protein [Bacteroidota bacterium]
MKTLQLNNSTARKLYPSAVTEFKEILEQSFGKDFFSQKITDRVKSFEDACLELGENPDEVLPYKLPKNNRQHASNDNMRLDVIAEALRQGYEADWSNSNEKKWRAWFEYKSTGFGFSNSYYADSSTHATVGSRLLFPNKEISDYFGTQFIEIHNRLLTNKY